MTEKHNSELHSWLSGEWKRKLLTRSVTDCVGATSPVERKRPPAGGGLFGADDWIDELEMLDAIFEDE